MSQSSRLSLENYCHTVKQDLNTLAYNRAFDRSASWAPFHYKLSQWIEKKNNAVGTVVGVFATIFGVRAFLPDELQAPTLGGLVLLAGTTAVSSSLAEHRMTALAVQDLKNGVLKDIDTSAPVADDREGIKTLARLQLARRKYLQAQFAEALAGAAPEKQAELAKHNAQSIKNMQRRDVELRQVLAKYIP